MDKIFNEELTVGLSSFGAELRSLVSNKDDREYVWQADSEYWGKSSPILFPIVGVVYNGEYRVGGEKYCLSRHGFARDREFRVVRQDESSICYRLESDAESLTVYPYAFILEVEYKLEGRRLRVTWRVKNPLEDDMYFQIGGHPAFNYEDFDLEEEIQGYLKFGGCRRIARTLVGDGGCVRRERVDLERQKGDLLPICRDTFKEDAFVIEDGQTKEISLLNRSMEMYLKVRFDAPVVGVWSPRKTDYSPFVCIEPWYGRADELGYEGDFRDKEWVQRLSGGEVFERWYDVEVKEV